MAETSEPMRVNAGTAPSVEAFPGVFRTTLAWAEKSMMSQTRVTAGQELPEHSHPHEQLTFVISGKLELRIGDATWMLGPGDCVSVPSDVPHWGKAHEDVVALDAFCPPREDFK